MISPTPPERSLQQRKDALERANRIRSIRAELKTDLKSGRIDISALLWSPPAEIETMKLYELLMAVPKFGRVKSNKLLQRCRISPSKTIGGLSERQRTQLVTELARRY